MYFLRSRVAALLTLCAAAATMAGCQCAGVEDTNLFRSQEEVLSQEPTKLPPLRLPKAPRNELVSVTNDRIHNNEATIPPQCYTKTEGIHNPCYTCHQSYPAEAGHRNTLADGTNQGDYSFSEVGVENHWANLFVDKSAWVAGIRDGEILQFVRTENYSRLRARLTRRGYRGYLPDLKGFELGARAFDERGLSRDGSGWVAYTYKPFLGTFWPTNGSTDDVLVRLPARFRERKGATDFDVYAVNLTLAELAMQGLSEVKLWEFDENELGVDIDQDGTLARTHTVKPRDHYIGDAANELVEPEQLPVGTEFLHSVRYLDVVANKVVPSLRMKELRYMVKVSAPTPDRLRSHYARERKEKLSGELPNFLYLGDEGYDNGLGYYVAGFIEDAEGELRPQSREEGLFCMGCHSAIGTTIDSTFSFARKVPGEAGFGYLTLARLGDTPNRGEAEGEVLTYLRRAGGGSEFRENEEMLERWFLPDGSVDEAKVRAASLEELITPSPARALELDKAYTYIVRRQSFRLGRDANVAPARNVFAAVPEEQVPLQEDYRYLGWDIRLDFARP